MSEQLYSAGEIATLIGETRHWVIDRSSEKGSPLPSYHVRRGDGIQHLWSAAGVDHWRAFHAGTGSLPRRKIGDDYSDHRAVNQVANTTITWKLWWQITSDGPVWWFSTPQSWWTSTDDGRSWTDTGLMVRPGDYRYQSINAFVAPRGSIAALLRSTEQLRKKIDR